MPFKSSGRYHMAGKIVACPLPMFRKILDNTSALLTKYWTAKSIIIPPLPRYLFSGCCRQPDHSTNIVEPGYSTKLLSETIGLCNSLKKLVCGLGISRCHVLDSCCATDCPATANTASRLEALKRVCAQDGVHFSSIGYDNLAASITNGEVLTADNPTSAMRSKKQHYWRGFRSTVGSTIASSSTRGGVRSGKSGRIEWGGRQLRPFHPYRRGKWRTTIQLSVTIDVIM